MHNLDAQEYLFDGNTSFGIKNLQTMVQADGKIAAVSAASILAKVTHDRDIVALAKHYPQYELQKHKGYGTKRHIELIKQHPQYELQKHKGYGTKRHIELIKQHGYSEIHRKSYKIKALEPTLF